MPSALAAGAVAMTNTAGAAAMTNTAMDWRPVAAVMSETFPAPWIARLLCPRPGGQWAIRWAAFDGRRILMSGPKIDDPPPPAEWEAGRVAAVPDIEAPPRAYLATVGSLDGQTRR